MVSPPNRSDHGVGNIEEIVNAQAIRYRTNHVSHTCQILTQRNHIGVVIFTSNKKTTVRHDNQWT